MEQHTDHQGRPLPPGVPPRHLRTRAYHVRHPNGDIDVYPPPARLRLKALQEMTGKLSLTDIIAHLRKLGIKVAMDEATKARLEQEAKEIQRHGERSS